MTEETNSIDDTVVVVDSIRRLGTRFWAVLAVAFLGPLVVILAFSSNSGARSQTSAIVGGNAPFIAGKTISGEDFSSMDYRGNWLVVNFFNSTCVPCIAEHPELVLYSEEIGPIQGAQLVSIPIADQDSDVEEFFAERGGDWPVLLGDTSEWVIRFGVTAAPETFVIDPFGVVRYHRVAQVDAETIAETIDTLSRG